MNYYRLANSDDVRQVSFNTDMIEYSKHLQWFDMFIED